MHIPFETRPKIFALLTAIERDCRDCLIHYGINENNIPKDIIKKIEQKKKENVDSYNDEMLEHIDFPDIAKLFHQIKSQFSHEMKAKVTSIAQDIEKLSPIRNRVCHSKPLKETDLSDCVVVSDKLLSFKTLYSFHRISKAKSGEFRPEFQIDTDQSLVSHNLPPVEYDDTSYIGREEEIKDLLYRLRKTSNPVISIVGEGGIGKTAFVLNCLYQLIEDEIPAFDYILWTSFKQDRLTDRGVESIFKNYTGLLESITNTSLKKRCSYIQY